MPIGPINQEPTPTQSPTALGKVAHHFQNNNSAAPNTAYAPSAVPNPAPSTKHPNCTPRRLDRFERTCQSNLFTYQAPPTAHPTEPPQPTLGPIPFSKHIQRTNEEDRRIEQPQPKPHSKPQPTTPNPQPLPSTQSPTLAPKLGHIPPTPQTNPPDRPPQPTYRLRIDQRIPAPGRIDLIG